MIHRLLRLGGVQTVVDTTVCTPATRCPANFDKTGGSDAGGGPGGASAASLQITAGMRQAADEGLPWPFEEWVATLYQVIDADGDGHITKQEYTDWLSALGLAEDTDIDGAFGGFDTNSDGNLSREEFSACYHQFWSDFDPSSPGHRWIGP
ncbi:MAG: EF-hand domain pair [Acidimicrobiaceae bacterium]|jgi:hypothetical protein|nr:EF-hand domain pair [Acidimicrobiaceae bacterium]